MATITRSCCGLAVGRFDEQGDSVRRASGRARRLGRLVASGRRRQRRGGRGRARPDLRAHPRGPRQGQGLGPQARAPEGLAGRLTARRQGGRDPALPRVRRVQDRHRQDHRRFPHHPLQLHDHQRLKPGSGTRRHETSRPAQPTSRAAPHPARCVTGLQRLSLSGRLQA